MTRAIVLLLLAACNAAPVATAAPPPKDAPASSSPAVWLLGSDGAADTGSSLLLSDGTWYATTGAGEQFVRFTVPLATGTTLTGIEIHGTSGNAPGEVLRAFFGSALGGFAQIGATEQSLPDGMGATIGWDFSAAPYAMIDAPHVILVGLGPVDEPGEVRVMAIRIGM